MEYNHPMSIKELADSLGVSKTTIRKRLTPEFRAEHTQEAENRVLMVSANGCKLIAESYRKPPESYRKPPQTTANQFAETPETDCGNPATDMITVPVTIWETLQEQLAAKDRQIEALQTALLAAQALHAGRSIPLLDDGSAEDKPTRRGFFGWLRRK